MPAEIADDRRQRRRDDRLVERRQQEDEQQSAEDDADPRRLGHVARRRRWLLRRTAIAAVDLALRQRPHALGCRSRRPHAVEQDLKVAAPRFRSGRRRCLEKRHERPHRREEVADGEVVAHASLLASPGDQPSEQPADPLALLGDPPFAARMAQEDVSERQVAGLELEHLLEEPDEALPRALCRGAPLRRRYHLADVLLEDGLDERLARREMAVESADPDPGSPGDLLQGRVRPLLGEHVATCGDQQLSVSNGVAPGHALTIAVTGGYLHLIRRIPPLTAVRRSPAEQGGPSRWAAG